MLSPKLIIMVGVFWLANLDIITGQPLSPKNIQFTCVQGENFPTTVARNLETEETLPVIRWQSQYFSASGYNNLTRCQQVSQRFQTHYDRNQLNYITAGVVNNLTVICATKQKGSCNSDNVLFTLEPDQDATETLQQLFDIRHYSAGPLLRGGQPRYPYIDMQEMLKPLQETSGGMQN